MEEINDYRFAFDYDVKCPGCNYKTRQLYVSAYDEKQAREEFASGAGVCIHCYIEDDVVTLSPTPSEQVQHFKALKDE